MAEPIPVDRLNEWYDELTVEIIGRVCAPDSGCLDIGAGGGEILSHMRRAAPRGRHFAVEPLPHYAEGLRRDFPGVTVWQAAAAATEGRDSFVHVVSNPGYSGLRRRPYDRADETLVEIAVDTVRLDDVVPADARVDLVKVDVEGGEVGALRGAAELLRRESPVVVFEHGGDHAMRDYGTTSDDLWALLVDDLGYTIHTLAGWLAAEPGLDRAAFAEELRTQWYFVAARGPVSARTPEE
ncbi:MULTISPECIES: FkbM family methyltransferase [Streptomyces]|uniref:FkbM family methyltransferase n=1 Tax=Streptomyces TaxID=1883 RepID=UPI00163CBD45|nr:MULTISPECIES: FkbM family methyltransferase [Streptomyces]MBC2875779.1 FkbM family methyltransferase [Streptomyces sp. TYQ1024]UBI37631.1 FkbM family methyltransferase [Streptomyces mobaraensis]UKW30218.1 FkbM family methyltransferase [Streptomyces sp. TYQ1024]